MNFLALSEHMRLMGTQVMHRACVMTVSHKPQQTSWWTSLLHEGKIKSDSLWRMVAGDFKKIMGEDGRESGMSRRPGSSLICSA